MRLLLRVSAAVAASLAAGTAAATGSGPEAARDLVSRTIASLSRHHDLHRLHYIRSTAQIVPHTVVENDHLGAPYFIGGVSRAKIVDDFKGGRRLVAERPLADLDAPSPGNVTRTLFTPEDKYVEYSAAGEITVEPIQHAPPSWETQNPLRALLIAEKASDLAVEPDVVLHEAPQHVVSFHHGAYRVRIYLDALTGLPTATDAIVAFRYNTSGNVAWTALGDIVERTEYLNWDMVDGVRFPIQWDVQRNGADYYTVTYSNVQIEPRMVESDFAMHAPPPATTTALLEDLEAGALVYQGPDPKRPIEEIAPGIVQIPNSWYTTLVRQKDGIVVIDAPISAGYSAHVLAEAERRFPGVPIKAVITSTGFYWHIAGVREYAARGIPIYVRDLNEPIVRGIMDTPHTLVPDDLARAPLKPILRAVSTRTVIGTGRHAIVLMPIRYGEQPMLMTWIADARLLHTAEMVQPLGPHGSLLYPESLLELKESVREAGIPTSALRMIGMHMSPTPWATLENTLHAAGG